MAIMRIKKTKDYTVMANFHLKDKRLSLKAKGLMSLMLMLPDDWEYSLAGLIAQAKEGKTAVMSALKELKEAGYLQVTKAKTETGQFQYIYDVYEQPSKNGKTYSEMPHTENQSTENRKVLNTYIQNTKIQSTDNKIIGTKVPMAETAQKAAGDHETESYGNPDINAAFDEWEATFGFPQKQTAKNRRAAYNLIRNKEIGPERLRFLIKARNAAQDDRYAPSGVRAIVDFSSLQENYSHLLMWAQRKYKQTQNQRKGFEL